jgi:2-keto-4-pentenoate hydratase/2-oxohepta-3-ene-1,7-dioic acid hydratase in catechol pathway
MKFVSFREDGQDGLAIAKSGGVMIVSEKDAEYPGTIQSLLTAGGDALRRAGALLEKGREIDATRIAFMPPLRRPGKIVCVGLNYQDHASESGMKAPAHPTVFARFASSLVGNGSPMVLPPDSNQFDYEGEFVAVIGRGGRRIPRENALDHVAGYSLFNDGSIRDVQLRTPQWTVGKNYDGTGAFGPFLVTADELPPGCRGLRLKTRLNGETVQEALTNDLIFDVQTLVSELSSAFSFEPGDIIVTGTPSGVGMARKPPLFMKDGDVCEVEMEGLGLLRNPIVAERIG